MRVTSPSIRCIVPVRAKNGQLFFDFFWRSVRCKEYTGLAESAENQRLCERKMAVVDSAIAHGSFDLSCAFSARGFTSSIRMIARDGATISFDDYINRWHKNRSPILADGRIIQDADIHPSTWIHDATVVRSRFVPTFRNLRMSEVTPYHCAAFRQSLLEEGLSGKITCAYYTKPSLTRSKKDCSSEIGCFNPAAGAFG